MAIMYTLRTAQGLSGVRRRQAYNVLDTIATRQIFDVLDSRIEPADRRTYDFERSVLAPAFAMSQRGVRFNAFERSKMMTRLSKEITDAVEAINAHDIIRNHWDGLEKETGVCPASTRKDGKHTWEKGVEDSPDRHCVSCGTSRFKRSPFNPGSSDQKKHLLYDILKVKKCYNKDDVLSADDECLDRVQRNYPKYSDFIDLITNYQKIKKLHSTLNFKTPDDRFYTNFNIGVTWTGRWSSQKNHHGYGGNAQNWTERLRHVLEPDPGYELWYADLKQAESNMVAHLAGDEEYIAAHKNGDVHTYVTRLVWDLGWKWDIKEDKIIAKQLPDWDNVPGHDYRFQSKRIQHGSNYGRTPFGIALQAHIPQAAAAASQRSYFRAFPNIPEWQRRIGKAVQDQIPLVSPLGIRYPLFGRPDDDHTYKQGLAAVPQGTVAHIVNMGVWRIWNELDLKTDLELLLQVHDAIVWQTPIGQRHLGFRALELMQIPIPVVDIYGNLRYTTIEVEGAVGLNWGHHSDENPDGIQEVDFPPKE